MKHISSAHLYMNFISTGPNMNVMIISNICCSKGLNNHTHYIVGGKCIYHPHIMATDSTLRE